MKAKRNYIFIIAAIFSLIIFGIGLSQPDLLASFLKTTNQKLLSVFSTWYLWFGLLIVLFAIIVFWLPLGNIRLGKAKPDYNYFSWIALLYSTGMGSGLLLRAVQEPVFYYINSPIESLEAAQTSLTFTFFHWGFTPWAMYSLFGLIVAYNIYYTESENYLKAVFVNQKNKWLVRLINIFIVLITIVGVIASLGLGAAQVLEGVNHVFKLNLSTTSLLWLVFLVGLIATLSALTGIKKVIKFLADFDLSASIILMVFVASFLNFPSFFDQTFHALKDYVLHFAELSLSMGKYDTSQSLTNDWTVFYWAFWIAWVPFTGIFIARISKGRSIKEFILATILIPAFATMIWFSVFGNMAFLSIGSGYNGEFDNLYTSLFLFLETLPLSEITILLTIVLVFTSIINSVDSAIFVLSIFSDEGNENPNKRDKIKWGFLITITALGLTAVGTSNLLNAVSSLLIIMALPFSFLYMYLLLQFLSKLLKHSFKKSEE